MLADNIIMRLAYFSVPLLILLAGQIDFSNAQCYLQQFNFSPRFNSINTQSCQNIPWEITCKLNCQWRFNCDSKQNKDNVRDFVAQIRLQKDSTSSEVLCCSASLPTIAQKCQSFRRTVVKPTNNKYLIRQPRKAQGQFRVVEKLALIQNGRSRQWDLDLTVCTYTRNPRATLCSRGRGAQTNKGKNGGPQQGNDQRNQIGNPRRTFENVGSTNKDTPRFREPGTLESLEQQGADPNALDTRRVGNLEQYSFDQLQNLNDFERLAVACGVGCSIGAATGIGIGIFLAYNFTSCFPITIESVEFAYSQPFLNDRLPHLTIATADCISPHTVNATAPQSVACNLGVWDPDPTDWATFCLGAPCPKFIVDNTTKVYFPDNFVSQASDGTTMTVLFSVSCIEPWKDKEAGTTPTPLECDDGIWGAQFTTLDIFATPSYCYAPCPTFIIDKATMNYSPSPIDDEAPHDTVLTVSCTYPYVDLPGTQSTLTCKDGTWVPQNPLNSFTETFDYCYDVCPRFTVPGTTIEFDERAEEQPHGRQAVVQCNVFDGDWIDRPNAEKPTHECRNGQWTPDLTLATEDYCYEPCDTFVVRGANTVSDYQYSTTNGEENSPIEHGAQMRVYCSPYDANALPTGPYNEVDKVDDANLNPVVKCFDGEWTGCGGGETNAANCWCEVNESNIANNG